MESVYSDSECKFEGFMSDSEEDSRCEIYTSNRSNGIPAHDLENDESNISISMEEFQNILQLKGQYDQAQEEIQDTWKQLTDLKRVHKRSEAMINEHKEKIKKHQSEYTSLKQRNHKLAEQHKTLTKQYESKLKGLISYLSSATHLQSCILLCVSLMCS